MFADMEHGNHGCDGPHTLALNYPSVRLSEVIYCDVVQRHNIRDAHATRQY